MAKTDFRIRIVVDTSGGVAGLQNLSTAQQQAGASAKNAATQITGSLEFSIKNLAKAALSAGAAVMGAMSIGTVIRRAVDEISGAQAAMAQVEAAIASTGGAAGVTKEQISEMASRFQQVTTFGDDAVVSMSAVLLTFTKIGSETFPRASQAILDLSARMGTDLQSSAVQVGKALNDPIQGITALSRVGVSFTEQQKEVIKHLVETGRVAEAQAVILKELETEFGGSAEAARKTLGGALQALQETIGNVYESIGEGLAPALQQLTEEANTFLATNGELARQVGELLGKALIFAAESAKFLAEHIELITAAIVAYAAYQAVFLFVQLADAIKKAVAAMAALNVTMAANPIGAIAALIGLAAGALTYFALSSDKATEATERQNSVLDENRRLLQEVASLQGRVTSNNVDQLRGNLLNLEGEYQKLQAEQRELFEDKPDYKGLWDNLTGAVDRYGKKQQEIFEREGKLSWAINNTKEQLALAEAQVKKNAEEEAKRQKMLDELAKSTGKLTGEQKKAIKEEDTRRKNLAELTSELEDRIAAEQKLLEAERKGTEETKNASRELAILELVHKKNLKLLPEEEAALRKLAETLVDLTDTREQEREARERAANYVAFRESIEEEILALQAEIQAMKLGADAVEELAIAKQILKAIEEGTIPFTLEAVSAYYQQLKVITELRKEKERLANVPKAPTVDQALDDLGFVTPDPWGNVDFSKSKGFEEAKNQVDELQSKWQGFADVAYQGWERLLFSVAGLSKESMSDIVKDMLKQWAAMLVQMAAQWAAQKFVTSLGGGKQSTTGAVTGAATDAAVSYGSNALFGGGSTTATAGATGASGSSALVAAGWTVAIFAAIYFGVSQWIKTQKKHIAQATLSLAGEGKLAVNDIHGNSKRVEQVVAALEGAGREVTNWLKALGGTISSFDSVTVGRKGQGKKTNWFVQFADGLKVTFGRDAEAAFEYAMIESLKRAEIKGLDPIVAAAIKKTTQQKWEAFEKDVALAQQVALMGKTQGAQEFTQVSMGVDNLIKEMLRILGPSEEFATALSNITAAMGEQLRAQRDQITGRKKTAEEEYQDRLRQAHQWNAELKLRKATLEAQRAELVAKLADARATIARTRITVEGFERMGRGAIGFAQMAGVSEEAIKQMEASLAAIDQVLANLPDEIKDEEVQKPGRKGGGNNRKEEKKDFLEQLRDIQNVNLSEPMKGFLDLEKQIAKLWEEGKRLKVSAAELEKAEAALREQYKKSLKDQLQPYLDIGKTDFTRGLEQGRKFFQDMRDLPNSSGIPNWLVDLAEGKWLDQQKEALEGRIKDFAGLTTPLDAIRKTASDLRQDIIALGLSSEETAAKLAEVAAAEEFRIQEAQLSLVGKLFSYLQESTQFEAERVAYEQQRIELEFAIIEAQLRAFQIFDKYAEIFGAAKEAALEAATRPRVRNDNNRENEYARRQEEAARQQEEAARKQKEAAERFAQSTQKLIDFQKSLFLDTNLSTLTPEQRLDEARRQYEAVAALALAGNVEAREQIPDVARQYLEIAREFFASSQGYTDIFAGVNALLNTLIGSNTALPGGGGTPANPNAGSPTPSTPPPQATGNLSVDPIVNQIYALRGDMAQAGYLERQGDKELRDKIDAQNAKADRLNGNIERLISLLSDQ